MYVTVAHQVVEQGHDEVLSGAHGAVVIALKGANGVIAVAGTLTLLVEAGHEAEGVVGKKAAAGRVRQVRMREVSIRQKNTTKYEKNTITKMNIPCVTLKATKSSNNNSSGTHTHR